MNIENQSGLNAESAEAMAAGMGFSLLDLADFSEKIKAALPKIKGFLPALKGWEGTLPKKDGEIILYSAIARVHATDVNKNTVIGYVSTARQLGQAITLADGTVLPPETLIIVEQHKKGDLGELADNLLGFIPG